MELPFPPTHPDGQHALEPMARYYREAREKAARPVHRMSMGLQAAIPPEGMQPEKWAAMNRAERRNRKREARHER